MYTCEICNNRLLDGEQVYCADCAKKYRRCIMCGEVVDETGITENCHINCV